MHAFFRRLVWGPLSLLLLAACARVGQGAPPQLSAFEVASQAQRGAVDASFLLADASGAPLSLKAEFRLKNDTEWKAAQSAGGLGQGFGLVAGKTPAIYHFVWDSALDAPGYDGPAVLRLSVANPYHTARIESAVFTLANSDAAPTVAFEAVGRPENGRLPLTLRLKDAESEPLTLSLRYSLDGGTSFRTAQRENDGALYPSSKTGENASLSWDVLADLGAGAQSAVLLEATAADALGRGPAGRSPLIAIDLAQGPALRVLQLAPSLRDQAPLSFVVYGDPTTSYTLSAEYRQAESASFLPLSQEIQGEDATRFLTGSPPGVSHVFLWKTLADFPGLVKTRDIRLRFELKDAYGKAFSPPQIAEFAEIGVDNAPRADTLLISEIYPGVKGQGAFIELYGPPGYNLSGHRLYEIWPDGSNGLATGQGVILFGDERIDASGLFVISASGGPAADRVDEALATFFKAGQAQWPQKDLPNSLILEIPGYDSVFDAVGYGDFDSMGYTFQGQGHPAPAIPLGYSLTRDFGNTSSRDNRLDFILAAPSPKSSRLIPAP